MKLVPLALIAILAGCSGVHVPDADTGDSGVTGDSGESPTCGALHGAVSARVSTLGCGVPNFRCPCPWVPIADSCFDRLRAAVDCDQLDRALVDCNAVDDASIPVCP